jgi:hypothetical protein
MPHSSTCKENIYAHFVIFNLTPRKENKRILSVVRISMLNATGGFSVVALHSFHSLRYNRSAVSKTSSPYSVIQRLFQFTVSSENALSWFITQQIMVILYRRFGTTYRVPSSGIKDYCPKRQ